ncbi:MAG: electron transport complex subunit RsxC [Kiritimatiellae bacterium]|nr:electron transport complex subunit RsxC [Kiritimatiellia bacterium]
MISKATDFGGKGTFARGVHPPDQKSFAEHMAIEVIPTPAEVNIPLLQHTGAPCEPTVEAKAVVAVGDKIGDNKAFISAPIHASVAGTVQKVAVATLPNGRHVKTLPIKAGEQVLSGRALLDDAFGGEWSTRDLERFQPADIAKAVREAGIVGLGGAAFPTHVKLTRNEKRPVDTLLVNGCECEPYLTSDHRIMIEAPAAVVAGALLAAQAAGASKIVVAIEDNKPQAAEVMRKVAEGTAVKIAVVKTKYPMGGERQVVPAVLGRVIPTGGLPLDVGVVVINVGTAAAIARAVLRGKALTHRVVTVTGAGIAQPKNLFVPVGISYGELIAFCGGPKPDAARVVAGGPMMGFTLGDLNAPVTKGTSGVVVLTHEDIRRSEETACVRCGRCVDVCPLNLMATKIALAARSQDWELAKKHHIMACIECGCCAYSCPASIPLVQLMRMGKAQILSQG